MSGNPTAPRDPESRISAIPRQLIRKLVENLRPPTATYTLQPPGQRSGHGSRSVEPYLREERGTRPGRLE
jgi:hypothetical protein